MNEQHTTPGQAGHPPLRPGPHPPPLRPTGGPPATPGSIRQGVVPAQSHAPTDKELEPLSLIEEAHSAPVASATMAPPPPAKKILAFGAETAHKKHDWKRTPHKSGTGAIRVKSFHGKYSEQGLEYLDNAINEWLDANPEVEIKFVTPTVLQFEGKIRENALVLNLWY
jgi:hypothetical protein